MVNKQININHYDLLVNQAIHLELAPEPYIVVLAIQTNNISNEWRNQCCDWIIKSGQCYWGACKLFCVSSIFYK